MKLVPAKCPSCGAHLKLDDNLKKVECEYCRTTIIVDEAIENHKLELSGKIEVDGIKGENKTIERAKTYIALEEFEKAKDELNRLINKDDLNVNGRVLFLIACMEAAKTEEYISYERLEEALTQYNRLKKIDKKKTYENELKKYLKTLEEWDVLYKKEKIINDELETLSRKCSNFGIKSYSSEIEIDNVKRANYVSEYLKDNFGFQDVDFEYDEGIVIYKIEQIKDTLYLVKGVHKFSGPEDNVKMFFSERKKYKLNTTLDELVKKFENTDFKKVIKDGTVNSAEENSEETETTLSDDKKYKSEQFCIKRLLEIYHYKRFYEYVSDKDRKRDQKFIKKYGAEHFGFPKNAEINAFASKYRIYEKDNGLVFSVENFDKYKEEYFVVSSYVISKFNSINELADYLNKTNGDFEKQVVSNKDKAKKTQKTVYRIGVAFYILLAIWAFIAGYIFAGILILILGFVIWERLYFIIERFLP